MRRGPPTRGPTAAGVAAVDHNCGREPAPPRAGDAHARHHRRPCRAGRGGRSSSSGTGCAPSSRPPATRSSSPAGSATTSPPATPSSPGSAPSRTDGPSCSTARSSSLDEAGRPNFGLLQDRMHVRHPSRGAARAPARSRSTPSTCCSSTARSLLAAPYDERRARLAELAADGVGCSCRRRSPTSTATSCSTSPPARSRGRRREAPRRRATSPGGVRPAWIKTALSRTQEVLIGGWTVGRGAAHPHVRLAAARRARRGRRAALPRPRGHRVHRRGARPT